MSSVEEVRKRTIHGVLKQKVAECGSREFFYFKDQAFTYEDLDGRRTGVRRDFRRWASAKGIRWPSSWETGPNSSLCGSA